MKIILYILQVTAQVLFFISVTTVLDYAAIWLHIPIPGGILALVLIFMLLKFRMIKPRWIERGAALLIAEMLLFFIPAAAGVIQFKELFIANGIGLVLVLVCSTFIVMMTAGKLVDRLTALAKRKETA